MINITHYFYSLPVYVFPFYKLIIVSFLFFFFNVTATSEIYTLSLHDALPILLFLRSWYTRRRRFVRPRMWNQEDRKSTRLNSSHVRISYAVFCLKKKKKQIRKTLYFLLIESLGNTFSLATLDCINRSIRDNNI